MTLPSGSNQLGGGGKRKSSQPTVTIHTFDISTQALIIYTIVNNFIGYNVDTVDDTSSEPRVGSVDRACQLLPRLSQKNHSMIA
jgi:hypothetical protein